MFSKILIYDNKLLQLRELSIMFPKACKGLYAASVDNHRVLIEITAPKICM